MFSYMLGSRFWHTIVAWLEAGISGDFPLDSLYNKYCERMLVFHKIIVQLMKIQDIVTLCSSCFDLDWIFKILEQSLIIHSVGIIISSSKTGP